jgi:hypothetical protein
MVCKWLAREGNFRKMLEGGSDGLHQTNRERKDDFEFPRSRHLEIVDYECWDDREADVEKIAHNSVSYPSVHLQRFSQCEKMTSCPIQLLTNERALF